MDLRVAKQNRIRNRATTSTTVHQFFCPLLNFLSEPKEAIEL